MPRKRKKRAKFKFRAKEEFEESGKKKRSLKDNVMK